MKKYLAVIILIVSSYSFVTSAQAQNITTGDWFSSSFQSSGSVENLVAKFDHSVEATSVNTYTGYVAVEISNFGWANSNEAYDAFYFFINHQQNGWIPKKAASAHRINFASCTYKQDGPLCGTYIGDNLSNNGQHFNIVYAEGLGNCSDININCIPPYNPDHIYRYILQITGAPAILNLGFGNSGLSTASGQYDIKITPVTALPACSQDSWSCTNWNSCSTDGNQSRSCTKKYACVGGLTTPAITQSCTYIPPMCSSWSYSDWSDCSPSGQQTRSIVDSSPSGCQGGDPVLNQSCTYTPPTCSSWTYSNWSSCTNGQQSRSVTSSSPNNCTGGSPVLNQQCTPLCMSSDYSCDNWAKCNADGSQSRNCTKTTKCEGGVSLPSTSQDCTPPPPAPVVPVIPTPTYQPLEPSCTEDTWSCGDWGICSPQGLQSRSCRKTFHCPNVETASPATDQYCEPPSRPAQQIPQGSGEISNQDTILKATVKLVCPLNDYETSHLISQGSGTVIDSGGIVLTNKHVVDGTMGCFVGFITNPSDEPYFGDRQIADIAKEASDEDVAILKIRNPDNKILSYMNISNGNSNGLRLGDQISIYGYPAIFGTNITYTSGVFSGTRSDSYLKTTAEMEHGNSGGGAYTQNGIFIGIPSEGIKGDLNALGYILPVNMINAWLNNTTIAYSASPDDNNYSRVSSVLQNIDLKNLGSFQTVVTGKSNSNNTNASVVAPNSTSIAKKLVPAKIIKQDGLLSSDSKPLLSNQKIKSAIVTNLVSQPQPSWFSRIINWFTGLFR